MCDLKEATKFDEGKSRIELIPPDALEEVGRVMAYGAAKYADRNWEKGLQWSRLLGATLRHLCRWASGENIDPESKLHHLPHAGANIMMLIATVIRNIGKDDRK